MKLDLKYFDMMQEVVDLIQNVQDEFLKDVVIEDSHAEDMDFSISDLKAKANRLKVDLEEYFIER